MDSIVNNSNKNNYSVFTFDKNFKYVSPSILGRWKNYTKNHEFSGERVFDERQILTNFASEKLEIVFIFSGPGDIASDSV